LPLTSCSLATSVCCLAVLISSAPLLCLASSGTVLKYSLSAFLSASRNQNGYSVRLAMIYSASAMADVKLMAVMALVLSQRRREAKAESTMLCAVMRRQLRSTSLEAPRASDECAAADTDGG
jgi:hypothetical protein